MARTLRGRSWAKLLMQRVDFLGWGLHKEFAACAYNIMFRRDQMSAVHLHMETNQPYASVSRALQHVSLEHFIAAAVAAGDCRTVADLLRKEDLNVKVKEALRGLQRVLRDVEGSEAQRRALRFKFLGMRLWNGFSALFFTLNPNDLGTPLVIVFCNAEHFHVEEISLDWNDAEMLSYYERALGKDWSRFHRLIIENPRASMLCFHKTLKLVLQHLLGCTPNVLGKRLRRHLDNLAALPTPGIFGHPAGFGGVVEPQMRKTLHIHLLVQLLGFMHPDDLFQNGRRSLHTVPRLVPWRLYGRRRSSLC